MKKVIMLAVLLIGLNGMAQQRRERPNRDQMEKLTPEQRQEKQLKRLTSDLDLNTKQQEEVKKLMVEQNSKMVDLRAEREAAKNEQALANSKERKEMAVKMKAEKEAHDAKMKKILSPEQFTKWENNRAIQQEKMRQKRGERKGERNMQNAEEN